MNNSSTSSTVAESRDPSLAGIGTVSLALWALVPVVFPYYIFKSGMPQISSALVVVSAIIALSGGIIRISGGKHPALRVLLWFIWYVALVNIAWALISDNPRMMRSVAYYVFNGIVVVLGLSLYAEAGTRFLRVTQHAFAFAVLSQLVLLLAVGSGTARATLYFDNPNQLGYFALVSASMALVLAERLKTPAWYTAVVVTASCFLALVSTSFAALGGFVILFAVALLRRPGVLVIGAIALAALLGSWKSEMFFSERVENERGEMEGVSFLESRGYDRIFNHPEHIFLGAGEGNYRDYESYLGKHEIHSSYGTLLFSYGVVGSVLFALFIITLIQGAGLRYALYLAPVLIYGIAHQGLRSPLLWMLLTVLVAIGRAPAQRMRARLSRVRSVGSVSLSGGASQ